MDLADLAALLEQGRFAECRAEAEALLCRGGLDRVGQAGAYLLLSRSLSRLQANQEALGPGELAVHYALTAGDNDLLGRAICHSAFAYGENRLYKQAIARLGEYFRYHSLYREARRLEGWVLFHLALYHQRMGRGSQAHSYYQKAYRWHLAAESAPAQVEQCRASLAWQSLRMGDLAQAAPLMEGSEAYLRQEPDDREARARHWNNRAYQAYLTGQYPRASEIAARVVALPGAAPVWKATACLTLHQTARALGQEEVAIGMAALARIHASVARRPDLEEEALRALVQMLQQQEGLPRMEELFVKLGL